MKLFLLNRIKDDTGVSGTGIVAEGAEFTDGKVVLKWYGEKSSVNIYDSLEDVIEIHGHDGDTEVIWE